MAPHSLSSVQPFMTPRVDPTPSPTPAPELSLHSGAASTNEAPAALAPAPAPSAPAAFHFLKPEGQPNALAGHLLVVYNQDDPSSKELADYYALKREIPSDHVLGIRCAATEEINRAQYNETIREPIISYLCQKNWLQRRSEQVRIGNRMLELLLATQNDIWAMVLMRGVPLKIAPDPSDEEGLQREPELKSNAAAVDSELALLPIFGLPNGGFAPNPFFDDEANGLVRAGPELATKIILVTRLDGPAADDVHRMIDDSLAAEKNRLAGLAVIDTRGFTDPHNGYTSGDTWMRKSRDYLKVDGWTIKFDDRGDIIPATDPCNHVAFYLGWYSGEPIGPWMTPPNRFVPGAIAYHLHSYSANTIRNANSNWVGPLIAHGAAATMGAVYEPYLALTPRLDIFTKRLLDGNSFAEAAYASQRGLSWMITVVGDPLYRPFAKPLDVALSESEGIRPEEHDWLLLQQLQRQIAAGTYAGNPDELIRVLTARGTGAIAEEGLGDLLQTFPNASGSEAAYKMAMHLAIKPVDRIRLGLKLAQLYRNRSQLAQAREQLIQLSVTYPVDALRFGVVNPRLPVSTNAPPTVPQPPTQKAKKN